MKDRLDITAYEVVEHPMPIRTADRRRDWMGTLPDRFAYRCLPLAIANQVGWDILSPVSFSARWNGRDGLDAIRINLRGFINFGFQAVKSLSLLAKNHTFLTLVFSA